MENLHLPLQLEKERYKVVKMNSKQKIMRFRCGWSGWIKEVKVKVKFQMLILLNIQSANSVTVL